MFCASIPSIWTWLRSRMFPLASLLLLMVSACLFSLANSSVFTSFLLACVCSCVPFLSLICSSLTGLLSGLSFLFLLSPQNLLSACLSTGLILCPALQAGGSSCNFSHGPCSPMARCASEITALSRGLSVPHCLSIFPTHLLWASCTQP